MVGKTTLLDAMFWTLYGYLPKWGGPKGGPADAVIKRGSESCSSTVCVQANGDLYEITRQRPTKLQVKKNGVVQEGKTSDLDKRMADFVGMTADQFLLCIYMPQKRKSASFFSMSDIDRTELLSTVAGLSQLDSALTQVKLEKSKTEKEIEYLKGKIEALETMVARFPEEKKGYQDKVSEALADLENAIKQQELIKTSFEFGIVTLRDTMNQEVQGINLTTDEAISGHDTKIRFLKEKYDSINRELSEVPRVPHELFSAVENSRSKKNDAYLSNLQRDKIIQKNESTQRRINEELDRMDAATKGNCNHCLQELPESSRHAAAMKHLQNAKALENDFAKVTDVIDLAIFDTKVEEALIALNKKQNELNERPLQLKLDMDSIMLQIKQENEVSDIKRMSGRKEAESVKLKYESKITTLEQSLKDAKGKVDSAQRLSDQLLGSLSKLEEREKDELFNLEAQKTHLSINQANIDELLDMIDLFGPKGFRTICFEDLISRISDRAGQLFSIMTDGLYGTRIEQAGETGKGEHRVVLRPIITRGGLEVPLDDLSGGAEATITLAYDVAISEAIAENSPLFLDEALDGLDSQGKGEALRLIEEVSRTRPVFLIDHTNEIKSSVQNVIQITYKNNTSTLEGSDEESDSCMKAGGSK